MLFIYNSSKQKLKLTVKMVGQVLQLLADDETSGKNITFDIARTDSTTIIDKLTDRFGEGIVIGDNPGRQFIKMDDAFVGYTINDEKETVMVTAHQLNHKPTPEEREKIIPRNLIVVISDDKTTVWTHKNNLHPSFPVQKRKIGDLTFTSIVPKWNNWKVLKFSAGILLENTETGVRQKLNLTSSTHNRKDQTKYSMNNLEISEWGERDKIFKPRQGKPNTQRKDNKKYGKQKYSSR